MLAAVAIVIGSTWGLLHWHEAKARKELSKTLENYLGGGDRKLADAALDKAGKKAVPALLQMVQTKDKRQNQAAYFSFLHLGTNAEAAVPDLIAIYQQKISPFSQQCAASSLASIGPAANKAILVLVAGAKSPNELVRCDTLLALGKMHAEPDLIMPALTNALNDPVPKVRMFACMALGMVGPEWNPAIHVLKSVSEQDPDKNVRALAASELTRIDFEAKFKARTP